MTLLFVWSLLTTPTDKILCTLWVNKVPTLAIWYQACPFLAKADKVTAYNMRDYFIVQFLDIKTGLVVCAQPAQDLPAVTCHPTPLYDYKILLVWHNSQSPVCGIKIVHEGEPSRDEILAACGMDILRQYITGQLVLKSFGTYQPPQPAGTVIYPPALTDAQLGNIQTSESYQVLAANLNWYGIADPVNLWQNQWDEAILKAGEQTNVPPRLIKALIGQESQFWPLWSGENEVGLIQLTDYGADTVMRWSAGLFSIYCPHAILPSRCDLGYALLYPSEQQAVRDVFRSSLVLTGTPRQAADQVLGEIPIYAVIIEVYFSASAEAVAPLPPSWDYAIAAYHSGMECIRSGSICLEGQNYVDEVTR